MASTVRSRRRAHAVRSRRRATAIGVPSAMVALIGVAFAASPAIAANNDSTALPFPTVCASTQSSSPSASASSSSASPSATATAGASSTATGKNANKAGSTSSPNSSPSASASSTGTTKTTTGGGGASASASPSPSASPSSTDGGFWGWLNGVWTWIFSDTTSSTQTHVAAASDQLSSTPDASASTAAATKKATVAPSSPSTTAAASTTTKASSKSEGGDSTASATDSADANCISSASAAALKAKAEANGTSEGVSAVAIPWVMKTPSMLMYDLTYNGVKTVKVWNASSGSYQDQDVLDFTASKLTIESMVTYSIQSGKTVYNNAGSGTTTTLIQPHLMVESMTAQLLGLIPQTYTPTNPPPLPVGLTVPLIPVLFTDVTTQLAFLNTGSITVPGFQGFAQDGVASPQ